jgi:hypothetical protein
LLSLQGFLGPLMQAPFSHASVMVQGFPSSQATAMFV